MNTITIPRPPKITLVGYDDYGHRLFDVHTKEHLGDYEHAAKLLKKEISRQDEDDTVHVDIRVNGDGTLTTLRCASQLISEGEHSYLKRALKHQFKAAALDYYKTATELFSQTKSA